MKRILFIVEKDFLSLHVGVARVILYYAKGLLSDGAAVDFAYADDNGLHLGALVERSKISKRRAMIPLPWYASSGKSSQAMPPLTGSAARFEIAWSKELVDPQLYDANVVTAPWICVNPLPPLPRVVGIIYDLVPNLAVAGCLRLPFWVGLQEFAVQHDAGFRYYLANAERILCISQSTRKDFLAMYKTAEWFSERILVDVPYTHESCEIEESFSWFDEGQAEKFSKNTVLLVNALDWRKGLDVIQDVLVRAARRLNFNVVIVGKERIPMAAVEQFFSALEAVGLQISWWRYANDEVLNACYGNSRTLLFPSVYEGLGLPVLEAQSAGLPVITSNSSSFPEINLNEELCVDLKRIDMMVEKLIQCMDHDQSKITRGGKLQKLAASRFSNRLSFIDRILAAS